jgi:hypothetical protein
VTVVVTTTVERTVAVRTTGGGAVPFTVTVRAGGAGAVTVSVDELAVVEVVGRAVVVAVDVAAVVVGDGARSGSAGTCPSVVSGGRFVPA